LQAEKRSRWNSPPKQFHQHGGIFGLKSELDEPSTLLLNGCVTPKLPLQALLVILVAAVFGPALPAAAAPQLTAPVYETRTEHDPNGIGKFYMGREIAHVMGHQAAGWLERPDREAEERTDLLIDAMQLKTGETVADIGAGSGYFCWRMAKLVGPQGKILGVDIQQEMLDLLQRNMAKRQITNVTSVLGTTSDPKLPPSSVDTILMVDVYHEFDQPYEMLIGMRRALKPGGRIVLVEFRAEDPAVNIKRVHKMSQEQAKKEFAAVPGFTWERTIDVLPQQHILIFKKNPALK
jgi:precorrin-6B methylase 2